MAPGPALLQFWQTRVTREGFLSCLSKEDLLSCRQVCWDFACQAAPYLFTELEVQFRSSTFTRPSRMAALERIGHHVKTFTFKLPHNSEIFLPPIIDPVTGEEQTFVYVPQVHVSNDSGARLSVPRYGSWEMTDMLVKQYPPLFHAATNIPSFVSAFTLMHSLKHLKIACDGQAPSHRYRRSVVDYALISLRVAVEQAPLTSLDSLTLLPIHPGALLYLQPNMGFGASPASRRRWLQIRTLTIHMDSFPYGADQPVDHLKLLHTYLRNFSNLQRFAFRWRGARGPCPLSLATEPRLATPADQKPMQSCPTKFATAPRPLKFRNLENMELENARMDASQVASFVLEHRRTLHEFNFDEVVLRSGTWDDALAPLTRISGSERWKEKQEEVMDVPIVLSPVGVSRQQLQNVIRAAQKRKDRLRSLKDGASSLARARSKTRELFFAKPDHHMKKFLQSSVFSWL